MAKLKMQDRPGTKSATEPEKSAAAPEKQATKTNEKSILTVALPIAMALIVLLNSALALLTGSSYVLHGFLKVLFYIVMVLALGNMLVTYFRNSKTAGKILLILSAAILGIEALTVGIILSGNKSQVVGNGLIRLVVAIDAMKISFQGLFAVFVILFLIAFILFLVLILKQESSRQAAGYILLSVSGAYLVTLMLYLLFKHTVVFIVLAVVGLIGFVVFKAGNSKSSGGGSYRSGGGYSPKPVEADIQELARKDSTLSRLLQEKARLEQRIAEYEREIRECEKERREYEKLAAKAAGGEKMYLSEETYRDKARDYQSKIEEIEGNSIPYNKDQLKYVNRDIENRVKELRREQK